MEALTPPAQLSEWHLLKIESLRTIQAVVDLRPKDDVIGFANFLLIAVASGVLEESLSEVAARLPEDVRQQMIEAGCIDPEDVPDDHEDVPDDHGNDIDDATAIRVGADVRGALDYDGDIDYFRFQAEQGESYQIDVALGTLDDSIVELYDADGSFLDANDDDGGTFASRLYWEAPSNGVYYVAVTGFYGVGTYMLTVSLSDLVDDHANSEERATEIRVGEEVRGAVGSRDDIDYFHFKALRGQIYRIYVARGTLDDSSVYLHDTDGSFLGGSVDRGGPFADGLYWEAPSNGERYVAVMGVFGIGSYTLTVSLADPIDDHGNSGGRATEITGFVDEEGADVRGAVDYDGDIDYFRFYATRGYSYQIDVALRTLDDSIVDLYDADGSLLDSNDNYGGTFASRLYWEAPTNGEFYVAVEGHGIGTYTLMVSIVDDHSSDFESATRIAIGESVRIVLHNYDDRDVLVFRARPDTEYVLTLDFQTGQRRGDAAGTTMALYDAGGRVLARLRDYFSSNGSRNKIMWQAATGGDYYIVVGNKDAFGIFALTVTDGEATEQLERDDHGNSEGNATAIRVGEMAEDMTVATGERLQEVKSRDKVICASRNDVPGYGYLDASGNNVGFDIDLCRALAAAVLGDPNKIEIRLITAAERGPTIQSGEVDMLVRTVTWTTSRDSQWGNYAQTMFYDGQGFLVRKDLGISSALELQGASVCVTQGTTTELNLQDFSNQNGLNIEPLTFEDTDAAVAAYEAGQCDAFTNDRSQLAVLSTALADQDAHTILPETISEEPLGPVVPHGDDQWFDIVKTVMGILIYAEAYGVSSSNVPTSVTGDTKVDRLFGLEGSYGQESLGISNTAAQDVIRAVGNYGEIYARNLGPNGINLPRSDGDRNALWSAAPCEDCPKGGQIYSAPLR